MTPYQRPKHNLHCYLGAALIRLPLKSYVCTWHYYCYISLIKIGTEFIRGVSGGERKRTNIGMELIIEPRVLFLDEPTTGLDANTAVSVVQLLKRCHCMSLK